jgi:hypothetical protein
VAEKVSTRPATAQRRAPANVYAGPNQWLVLGAAWLVPGAGHLWLGRRQKGLTFLIVLPLMFVFGLVLEGRLFPFAPSEPLVALAAIADVGVGLPNLIARGLGYGAGLVTAVTWEYGNTFTIVAGLLNMLVVLDAFDVMEGRK